MIWQSIINNNNKFYNFLIIISNQFYYYLYNCLKKTLLVDENFAKKTMGGDRLSAIYRCLQHFQLKTLSYFVNSQL